MGSKTIGLSEDKINKTLTDFNSSAQDALDELNNKLNDVLEAIGENWGTQDAVKYTGETLIPSFEELQTKVAQTIKEIGLTIRATGIQQAQDTNNSINPIAVSDISTGALNNQTQDKLSNGFIGVYNTLDAEVTKAQTKLADKVENALDKLKKKMINDCEDAFTDEGTSKVSETCDTYIGQIKTAIKTSLDGVSESLKQLTAQATQYAKDIQSSGLRAASGTGA